MRFVRDNHPFLWLVIFIFLVRPAGAQTPRISILDVDARKGSLSVVQVEQDDQGYLWLGTNRGILRFDGVRYETVSLPDSMLNYECTSLFLGSEEVLAGFDNGCLAIINRQNLQTVVHDYSQAAIGSICVDDKQMIWLGTSGDGVYQLGPEGAVIDHLLKEKGLADDYVNCIVASGNKIFIGTDLGLTVVSFSTTGQVSTIYETHDGLTDSFITTAYAHDNEVLLGMHNGTVTVFDQVSNTFSPSSLNDLGLSRINFIARLNSKYLFITESEGAFLTSDLKSVHLQQFDLSSNANSSFIVQDACVDREGNLILTTRRNYLTVCDFRIQFIVEHDGQSFANAHCVFTDQDGDLIFSNDEGIFVHHTEFSRNQSISQLYRSPAGSSQVITMCDGPVEGTICFGTFGSGVGIIEKSTGRVSVYTEADGLQSNSVLSIARRSDEIWLATLGGISSIRFDHNAPVFQAYDSPALFGTNYIYSVYADESNRVWFGTDGAGLGVLVDGEFQNLSGQFPGMGKSIVSVTGDTEGRIWFYSTDRGLQFLQDQTLTDAGYSQDDNAEIYSIKGDPFGNILALTSEGMALINPEYKVPRYYLTEQNLESDYVNVMSVDTDNQFWIGTRESMIRFRESTEHNRKQPSTILEQLLVMLEPGDTSQHEYPFNRNHFTFRITSIWLQQPEAVSFRYKLDGYDMDWVFTLNRTIVFSSLQPGDYTFRLQSSADGNWENLEEITYKFTIMPPFWQRWWFIAGSILLISLIVYVIVRMRINALRRRELAMREKVQSQFDTLRNQVNPHFLFNSFNTLISIIGTDQRGAIDYVEKLSDYFRIVLEQRDKDVITVKEELELVKNYLFLQKRRFGENLQYEIDIAPEVSECPIPPLTMQILIENAIKHNIISRSKPLRIVVRSVGYKIVVSNNLQEKLTREPSTGIGLENVRNRFRILFNQAIEVDKTEDTFTVVLPLTDVKSI